MKIKNKTYIFLTAITLFMIWYLVGRYGLFASWGDWSSQHSVIPDYFRQQFYETGRLFLDFAPGLGGGQNIYNFSYYGLYSPVILISYLLPFVKMSDYLMAASVLCLMASVSLMHFWLKSHGFSADISFCVTVLFLMAAPVIYQFHRQVMFVNYMPFLCMALIGADRYWEKGKTGLYTAGVFGMILTSFYFSIAGIFALLLYGMSRRQKKEWKRPALRLLLPVAAAAAACGVLLVPTAYALFTRNADTNKSAVASLFFPDFSIMRFAYSGYGIGLTVGILTVLFLLLFHKKKRERLLSACCLVLIMIPFFSWLFNGALYARGKSLIPFLPVLCYLTASCLERIQKREFSLRICLAGYLMTVFWSVISFFVSGNGKLTEQYALAFTELALLPLAFALYRKIKFLPVLILPAAFCLFFNDIYLNVSQKDKIDQTLYEEVTDTSWKKAVSDVLNQETGLFRLEQRGTHEEKLANINRIWDPRQWSASAYSSAYQEDYKYFREHVFQTEQPFRNCLMQSALDNPLFQKFMGVKYLVGKEEEDSSVPYNSHTEYAKNLTAEIQDHAAPVIYTTDSVISKETYQNLTFPYNQTALMQYAVVEGDNLSAEQRQPDSSGIYKSDVFLAESSAIHKTDNGYHIQSGQKTQTVFSVLEREKDPFREQLFFIQFDVENHRNTKDVIVEIEGIRNNLSAKNHVYYNGNTTFTFVMKLEKNQKEAAVLFGKGDYTISNIRSYLGEISILNEDALYQSAFSPNWSLTKGNRICGEIDAERDGYLITSIPCGKGFEIRIDGRKWKSEIVNTAFLGAKITKGAHNIEIIYHAPGIRLGKLLSCIGFFLWGSMAVMERKRKYAFSLSFGYNFLTCFVYNRKKVRTCGRRNIYGKHIDYRG